MLLSHRQIAVGALVGIAAALALRFASSATAPDWNWPLWVVLAIGGGALLLQLARKAWAGDFGSDLLAGISIVASVLLREYLVGAIVVLMLSGGNALEDYATRKASGVLRALAQRRPELAHRRPPGAALADVPVGEVRPGDRLVVLPYEVCPVDGVVVAGAGRMNEAYLTGEPFEIAKTVGSEVISGAVNGETVLEIEASRPASSSRFEQMMRVIAQSEADRPRLRRLADRLGAWYTLLALVWAGAAWAAAGVPERFLAVLVIATPCPLLIGVPVALLGGIAVCARNGIVIRQAAVLEEIGACREFIVDKTGTLTYGRPELRRITPAPGCTESQVLTWAASLEQYSKHPLAAAITAAAADAGLALPPAAQISERPGEGLRGEVDHGAVLLGGRRQLAAVPAWLPPSRAGLECLVWRDCGLAGLLEFEDRPREDTPDFLRHLGPRHGFQSMTLLSGDRLDEVRRFAEAMGLRSFLAAQSPEDKLRFVRERTRHAPTLFLGDGLNDAAAMLAATVGVAFGQQSSVTSQAAGAVILEARLTKLDALLHIGPFTRAVAVQCAIGGMALSLIGMLLAAFGLLPPLGGAIAQEVIDLITVLYALRAAWGPRRLADL